MVLQFVQFVLQLVLYPQKKLKMGQNWETFWDLATFDHKQTPQLILYVINESAGESKFILQLFEYHRDIRGLSPGSIILKVWGSEKTSFLSMIIRK